MTSGSFNAKKSMMLTRMIFLGHITGVLFFMVIIYHLGRERFSLAADFGNALFLALSGLAVVTVPLSWLYSKKKLGMIPMEEPLASKYMSWQYTVIIRLAAVEGIALFSAVCLLITGNLFYMIFFIIALALQAINWPSPGKIAREINLTETEIEKFYQNM
jgi:hypothetical protein